MHKTVHLQFTRADTQPKITKDLFSFQSLGLNDYFYSFL